MSLCSPLEGKKKKEAGGMKRSTNEKSTRDGPKRNSQDKLFIPISLGRSDLHHGDTSVNPNQSFSDDTNTQDQQDNPRNISSGMIITTGLGCCASDSESIEHRGALPRSLSQNGPVNSSCLLQQAREKKLESKKMCNTPMQSLERGSDSFAAPPNPSSHWRKNSPINDVDAGSSTTIFPAGDPPVASLSPLKNEYEKIIQLPSIKSLKTLRKSGHLLSSSAPVFDGRSPVTAVSIPPTRGDTSGKAQPLFAFPKKVLSLAQSPLSGTPGAGKPSPNFRSPLLGTSNTMPPVNPVSTTSISSSTNLSITNTSTRCESTSLKSIRVPGMSFCPSSPSPPPARKMPSPVFTATESKQTQRTFFFHSLRRGRCAGKASSDTCCGRIPGRSSNSDTVDSIDTQLSVLKASDVSNTNSSTASSSLKLGTPCEHRHAATESDVGGARDHRRESEATLPGSAPEKPRCAQSGVSNLSSEGITLPPNTNSSSLDVHVKTLRRHTRVTNGVHSDHNEASDMEEVASSHTSTLSRRLKRSDSHLMTLCTSLNLLSDGSFSTNVLLRPMSRHASSLSLAQQEALRHTSSFYSRAHSPPPPPSLRESVTSQKKRRGPHARSSTPNARAASPGAHTAGDLSLLSPPTEMITEVCPSVNANSESKPPSSTRSSGHRFPSDEDKKDSVLLPACSKSRATTSVDAALPSGPSIPARHSTSPTHQNSTEQEFSGVSRGPGAAVSLNALRSPPLDRSTSPHLQPRIPSPPTKTPVRESKKSAPVSSAGHDLPRNTLPKSAPALGEAAAIDYDNPYRMYPPSYKRTKPQHYIAATLTPLEGVGTVFPDDRAQTRQQRKGPSGPSNSTVNCIVISPKKQDDVSASLSESTVRNHFGVRVDASFKNDSEGADARVVEPAATPVPPAERKSQPDDEHVIRPPNSPSVVSVCVDTDNDNAAGKTCSTDAAPVCESPEQEDTSCGGPSPVTTPPSVTWNNHVTSDTTTTTPPPLSGAPSPPASDNTVVPTPLLLSPSVPSTAPPAKLSITKLDPSSEYNVDVDDDDDDESEEDTSHLLVGFCPTGFDARRGTRNGSSIVFHLQDGDSLTSLDVVVTKNRNACLTTSAPTPPISFSSYSLHKPQSPEYSMLNENTAEEICRRYARPRVTFDPYVIESTHLLDQESRPRPINRPANSHAKRDSILGSELNMYDLLPDASTSSVAPNASSTEPNRATGAHSASAWPNALFPACVSPSIFLGTTARFAPDKSKMHRPIENTFGHTKARRRARATSIATALNTEGCRPDAIVDHTDVYNEEDVYGDVYTDDNGDEWYWEEVEDDAEDEEEEESLSDTEDSFISASAQENPQHQGRPRR